MDIWDRVLDFSLGRSPWQKEAMGFFTFFFIGHRPTQTHTDEKDISADDTVGGKTCLPFGQKDFTRCTRTLYSITPLPAIHRQIPRAAGDIFSPGRSPGEIFMSVWVRVGPWQKNSASLRSRAKRARGEQMVSRRGHRGTEKKTRSGGKR